ncbi:MAG: S41 family peptidase [Gemmatimonadaceae bacterium]
MSFRRGGHTRSLFVLLAAMGCARAGHGPLTGPGIARAPVDSIAAVASFDTAWARIGATYYDTTFRGNDWAALRRRFRPFAERARAQVQVRQAIESLFVRLGDTHFALIPDEVAATMRGDSVGDVSGRPGTAGLHFRLVGNQLLIAAVEANSYAAFSGVRAGWEVLRVGSVHVAPLLAARGAITNPRDRRRAELQIPLRLESATRGVEGSVVELELREEDGRLRQLAVARSAWDGEVVKYGPLPPQFFAFEHRRYGDSQGCVGLIRFSVWMTPLLPRVERAMEELSACRGIVIDLRGNTGGVAALVMGMSGFFVDRHVSLGTLTARGTTLRYVVNPRRSNRRGEAVTPFGGNLAILVDRLSASTSELFAAGMRDIGRARVFGDTTAGEALPATMAKLANGDLLIHAIADFHAAGGARIEATGVIPDVVLPLRRRDLLIASDVALEASLKWAGERAIGPAVPEPLQPLRP